MQTQHAYQTDLSDFEGQLICGFFPDRKPGEVGRPREIPYRRIVNALLYLVRTGGQGRLLPRDFPAYSTVSDS